MYGATMVLLAACSAAATPQVTSAVYRCHDGRWFTVARNHNSASIRYADTSYNLSRRPSSLGMKYSSAEATLIIDHQFAAFVTETLMDLEQCYEVE